MVGVTYYSGECKVCNDQGMKRTVENILSNSGSGGGLRVLGRFPELVKRDVLMHRDQCARRS